MITAAGVRDIMNAPTLTEADASCSAALLDQSFVLGVVTELMIAIGAVILVLLMARIERRCAIRDREIRAADRRLTAPPRVRACPGWPRGVARMSDPRRAPAPRLLGHAAVRGLWRREPGPVQVLWRLRFAAGRGDRAPARGPQDGVGPVR